MPDYAERFIQGEMTPLGDEQNTSLSTVQTLTPPGEATVALISCTTQGVRYRYGIDPTSAIGIAIPAGLEPVWVYNINDDIRFFEMAASAAMDVQYFK